MNKNYIRLDMEDKENLKKYMRNILEVWDNHCIYICPPSTIFSDKKEWNNIDVDKMLRVGDYKTFLNLSVKEAYNYVQNRLGHELMEQIKEKGRDNAESYLAVVEQYLLDGESNYLVRGIIRGDINGLSVLFNPEYIEAIPKTPIEAFLRADGDESVYPKVYQKHRK